MAKKVEHMTRYEILSALLEDGFDIDPADAADVSKTIQEAARQGALTWTSQHVISVLRNKPLNITK